MYYSFKCLDNILEFALIEPMAKLCDAIWIRKLLSQQREPTIHQVLGFKGLLIINLGGILEAGVYSSIIGSAKIAGQLYHYLFWLLVCALFSCFPYTEFSAQIIDSGYWRVFGIPSGA